MYHPVPAMRPDRFSIFSHSLGDHSVHQLPFKLTSAACGGFSAVEISLIDLEDYASSIGCSLLKAAHQIGGLCKLLGLSVSCLQPLRDVVESKCLEDVVQRTTSLFPIMDALNTQLLVCCSSFLPKDQIDGSIQNTILNLRAMGTAAASWFPNPKKIAFEALSWGTSINLWSQAWEVVKAVDLENVGICLDSFNTLAREWADPTVEGGVQADAHKNLRRSMDELSRLPGLKIFLLQIGDGARLKNPIEKGTAERPALMTWSRSSRLFPMEEDLGGYLPVKDFIQAVLSTGYNGYWSLEVFNDSLKSPSLSTPIAHALRGFNGLSKLENFILSSQQHNLSDYHPSDDASEKLQTKFADIQIHPYDPKSDSSECSFNLSPTDSCPSEFIDQNHKDNQQLFVPDTDHHTVEFKRSHMDSHEDVSCDTKLVRHDVVSDMIVF